MYNCLSRIVPEVYDDVLSGIERESILIKKINEIIDAMEHQGIKAEGVYDPNKKYDAFTMVSYDGALYVSTQPVPEDTPPTNEEYWRLLLDVRDIITSEVGDIIARMATLEVELQNQRLWISEREMKFKYRKYLVLGDSYAFQPSPWTDVMKSRLSIPNDSWNVVAKSGAGFTIEGNKFINQLQQFTGNKSAITDIIVGGGLNDSSPMALADSKILSEVRTFANYVKGNFVNATVRVFYIGNALDDSEVLYDRNVENRMNGVYQYARACADVGIEFVNMHNVLATNAANFAGDKLHPSHYGGIAIGEAISNYLLGGTMNNVYPYYPFLLNPVSGTTSSVNGAVKIRIDDNTASIFVDNDYVQFVMASNITGGNRTRIATSNYYFNKKVTKVVNVQFSNFDSVTFQYVECAIEFDGYNIFLTTRDLNEAGTGYKNHTKGVNAAISIPRLEMNIPTWYIN